MNAIETAASMVRIAGLPGACHLWYVRLILAAQRRKYGVELEPAWRVDEATFADLREHFDDQAILELAAPIAYQNLSSKFNAALAVPSQGFCTAQV